MGFVNQHITGGPHFVVGQGSLVSMHRGIDPVFAQRLPGPSQRGDYDVHTAAASLPTREALLMADSW
jgi:hypothetical protein